MNRKLKSLSFGLAMLGYVVSVFFLGREFFTFFSFSNNTTVFVVSAPLVPFTFAAIAALLLPSTRWSVVVATITGLLLIAGISISFQVVRDEWFIFAHGLVVMGETTVSLVLLVTVSIAHILLRRRLNETHAA